MDIRSQLQYRMSLLLTTVGQFLTAFTYFFGLDFVMQKITGLDGFTRPQVMLCFAVVMAAFSVGELFGHGFQTFPSLIARGELDRLLIRPRAILPQILLGNLDLTRFGLLIQAGVVLCIAIPRSGIVWTLSKSLCLLSMILCGSAVFFGLFLLKASLSFFTIQELEVFNIFTYGARQFGRYPFSVYGEGVLRLLTWVVPLALFQYYPMLWLFDRAEAVNAFLPLVSLVFLIPCYLLYRFGLKRYQSAGS
ncbi:MAG: ABC-2 family transporter protein [Oscillospiraceae bacterium]|nr:ABC-2 family transporter protein [Oscillospiraceae bacterium]